MCCIFGGQSVNVTSSWKLLGMIFYVAAVWDHEWVELELLPRCFLRHQKVLLGKATFGHENVFLHVGHLTATWTAQTLLFQLFMCGSQPSWSFFSLPPSYPTKAFKKESMVITNSSSRCNKLLPLPPITITLTPNDEKGHFCALNSMG